VIKVNPEIDVSMDKHGPKIHLAVRAVDDTVQSADTRA
jgi:hypothetical protein